MFGVTVVSQQGHLRGVCSFAVSACSLMKRPPQVWLVAALGRSTATQETWAWRRRWAAVGLPSGLSCDGQRRKHSF